MARFPRFFFEFPSRLTGVSNYKLAAIVPVDGGLFDFWVEMHLIAGEACAYHGPLEVKDVCRAIIAKVLWGRLPTAFTSFHAANTETALSQRTFKLSTYQTACLSLQCSL